MVGEHSRLTDSISGGMKVRHEEAKQSVVFVHKTWDGRGEEGRGDHSGSVC